MNKVQFQQFVDLYHLGGIVNSVKYVVANKVMSVSFMSEDRSLAGTVVEKAFDFEDIEFGINDTVKLKTLFKALSTPDIDMTKVDNDGRLVGLTFTDKAGTELQMMLADLAVIAKAPKIKEPDTFEIEIPISSEFTTRFITAKNALSDASSFTLKMSKKNTLELVIGWAPDINTDQIRLAVTPTAGKDTLQVPISFNADHFRAILAENSDATGAVFKVSTKGLATVTFDTKETTSTYYLIQKKLES